MDTIVTLEGRRQIANADLKIRYVSFTDGATYYKADITSGSADATTRLYLEQCHLPQDQITFEADDGGRLTSFSNGSGINVKNGQILDYSFQALTASVLTGSNQNMQVLTGDQFASQAQALLASSIDNFNRLRLIGTKDAVFEDDGFNAGNKQIEFTISNNRPLPDPTTYVAHLSNLESLFQDVRLSRIRNFRFLPPVNKVNDASIDKRDVKQTAPFFLGYYKPWSTVQPLTVSQLEYELQHYEQIGFSKVVNFDPTSIKNNLVGQVFESNFSVMKKLDVIDFGEYEWQGSHRHTFFVGKVMIDSNMTDTFIHLFTLVFG